MNGVGRHAWRWGGLAALSLVVACTEVPPEPPTPAPEAPPERPAVEPTPPEPTPELTDESRALQTYYRRLQNDLLAQGLLRGDGGGPDAPYTDTMLARNFVRIALFDEFYTTGGSLRVQETVSRVRRWDRPVRMKVDFGRTVPDDQRVRDKSTVATYAARLGRISGVPVSQVTSGANYHVIIANQSDRDETEARIRDVVPNIGRNVLNAMVNPPRDQLCVVVAFSEEDGSTYAKAIAVIRAEHPDLLRSACIHEELAQGFGLANDSPLARPSIFNDDQEFGLLTAHDENLLRMLYDPRLRTGMSAAEAAPIAREIARELMASGSS